MRAPRSRASSTDSVEPETPCAGAVRALEPVLERMAREAHLRFLIRSGLDSDIVQSVERSLARGASFC